MQKIHDFLIAEWRQAWKFWSVRISALGLAMMVFGEIMRESWSILPPSLAERIPHAETIGIVLFGLNLVSRLLKQGDSKS